MIRAPRSAQLPTTSEGVCSPPTPARRRGHSEIVCIQAHFSPSFHEKDCMYDGIVNYLRNRTLPQFLKLATDRQQARADFRFPFRRKCEAYYINEHGVLVEGRARGLHRHVLRRGELVHVMKFIHENLGHCSAEVCAKVAQPAVWSNEPFDLTAYSVIKHCECREKNATRRWFPCRVECAGSILLSFERDAEGGYDVSIRSTAKEVDLALFQKSVTRCARPQPKLPEILIDGRYRIDSRQELEDVLEKLHSAFGHCGPGQLRILFKSRFHYPVFYLAIREICSRCWFCKLEPQRKHFSISDYTYKIEVTSAKDNSPRRFFITPQETTVREVQNYINEILEKSRRNIDLEAAAAMANGADQTDSSPNKIYRIGDDVDEALENECSATPRPSVYYQYRERSHQVETQPKRPRLIPPSEISLGPTTSLEASESDTSMRPQLSCQAFDQLSPRIIRSGARTIHDYTTVSNDVGANLVSQGVGPVMGSEAQLMPYPADYNGVMSGDPNNGYAPPVEGFLLDNTQITSAELEDLGDLTAFFGNVCEESWQ
ncbi:unnamed protein product [Cylicocyclus nassatus]|uniref:Uncharacterized protein n=1 Tax=Cylicocyclus nassatus TaxID=53992 RepID=A0AA36GY74_CYLNA|nr:unnamed protein product [Cylicocyclus nassatus]